MLKTPITLIDYQPQWQDSLIRMWRESFEFGVGIIDPHPISAQVGYFQAEIIPKNTVRCAFFEDQLVGFVAASPDSVAQLHVRLSFHRLGIGSYMLDWAKIQSSGSLWLYTFARNSVAQAFYERHGFRVVERGHEPTWKLDDIKYAWSAAVTNAV